MCWTVRGKFEDGIDEEDPEVAQWIYKWWKNFDWKRVVGKYDGYKVPQKSECGKSFALSFEGEGAAKWVVNE